MNLYVDGVELVQFADATHLLITGKIKHFIEMIATLERALTSPQSGLRLVQ